MIIVVTILIINVVTVLTFYVLGVLPTIQLILLSVLAWVPVLIVMICYSCYFKNCCGYHYHDYYRSALLYSKGTSCNKWMLLQALLRNARAEGKTNTSSPAAQVPTAVDTGVQCRSFSERITSWVQTPAHQTFTEAVKQGTACYHLICHNLRLIVLHEHLERLMFLSCIQLVPSYINKQMELLSRFTDMFRLPNHIQYVQLSILWGFVLALEQCAHPPSAETEPVAMYDCFDILSTQGLMSHGGALYG